jgi:DeoR family fructose operon transcriptional repressor
VGTSDDSIHENVFPAKRHLALVQLVHTRSHMTVDDLSSHFGVSPDTVRRNLDLLASQGLLKRTHGGATTTDNLVNQDSTFIQRMSTRVPAKKRIAQAASHLIGDRETLLLNGGSTTRLFAIELSSRRNLTIVTNNLTLPPILSAESVRDVYLIGGKYRGDAQVTIGPVSFVSTGSITVDCAVIGIGGITVKEGLTTTLLEEASMILGMMDAARRTIVLADASKLGRSAFAQVAPLERIGILVTDEEPPKNLVHALKEARVDLIIAAEA